jgi:hypothetical protein
MLQRATPRQNQHRCAAHTARRPAHKIRDVLSKVIKAGKEARTTNATERSFREVRLHPLRRLHPRRQNGGSPGLSLRHKTLRHRLEKRVATASSVW